MTERKDVVNFKGNPLTLLGDELKPGMPAPQATLAANDMSPVTLASFRGKTVILSCVPSLDTPTCDLETRRFNKEAAALAGDIVILTVSRDLPFAQARWCGAAGVDKVKTLSDYAEGSFGKAYGIYLKEWNLLARVIFVLDKTGIVRYVQYVKDVSTEPDYDAALKAAKAAL